MPHSLSVPEERGLSPSVLIVSDSQNGEDQCRSSVDAIGGRVIGVERPEGARRQIDEKIVFDVALVDLNEDHGPQLDELLQDIERAARAGRYRSVISVPIELVDIVDAHIEHPDIALLCAPGQVDRAAALGLATAGHRLTLRDIGGERGNARLRRLSEEAARIASALADLSHGDAPSVAPGGNALGEAPFAFHAEPVRTYRLGAEDIRAIIRMRRSRDRFFDAELFADPAWDMLLDLMAARIEGRQVAVSSLCIAAAVPPTTALRWIRTMTDRGLFVRRSDPRDGRRIFIDLADEAAEALDRWFAEVHDNGDVLPS
ncbi:MarR family transcriptional regulator [Parasphingopyxis sp. CP4]|uniref:MarR family transcriptional regulator n=1 Tax=Parasphingopyxis sp. CP4 TaxID=2724527 RepID=UPI00159FB246|nr:MarR family transcriptional regulator [Parasphingopyxis sp. CP4]QLC21033.1 MarR family transcriptional regulator [Parasphingopyxis sp. CP4]